MIPLFDSSQVRKADAFGINNLKISGEVLMENAAIAIKDEILREFPFLDTSSKIGIVCGKGNNGGDGFALARQFVIDGFSVDVISIGLENQLRGEALANYKIFKNLVKLYKSSKITTYGSIRDLKILEGSHIIVDAILGTGSSGELKNPYDKIIVKLNEFGGIKIAVDSPTGLDLSNSSGKIIFNADLTVTLAEFKSGLFYEKGKHNSGKVVKGSIGIGDSFFQSLPVNEYLIEPEDVFNSLPRKEIDLNKYSAGKVLAIAGSGSMPGAAIFVINAAMNSGAGSGYLAFPKSIKSIPQTQMNSAIVFPYEDDGSEFLRSNNLVELSEKLNWSDVIAIGPGLGRENETKKFIFETIQNNSNKSLVIDADAIHALKNRKYRKLNLSKSILTPHHAEFAALLGVDINELKLNLFKYGRKFVKETKSFLVLKGAPTLIFNPDGEIFINTSGNSGLAKFGTGDVLTGIIASFIAQSKEIEKSVIAAVYLHGLTADLLVEKESEFGITPQKIIENFPESIEFLRNSIV